MRNEEYQEIKKQEKILHQPTFLKRMLAGLIDILLFLVVSIGLSVITKYSLYGPLGYNDAVEVCSTKYKESNLYLEENKTFYAYSSRYDNEKSPETNLDDPLTKYYSFDLRAKEANKLEEYTKSKLDSGLFIKKDEVLVRSDTANDDNVKELLMKEYGKAIKFFSEDPELIENQRTVYFVSTYSRVIIVFISGILIYFVPPICSKFGETLGHRCLKICLSTRISNLTPTKAKIAIRSSVFIVFNILAPILLQIQLKMIALIPIFITIIMMSFSKTGSSIHDSLSKTYVVYKHSMLEEVYKNNKKEKKEYGLKHI